MVFYTYLYRDPTRNNEPIYIGKGKDNRAYDHLKSKANKPLPNRIKKIREFGLEPIIEFLCKNVDEELAFFVEEEAISLYGRKDLGTGTLLNLTAGGDGVSNVSEETRKKLSAAAKGRVYDDAYKENMSKVMTGKKKTDTHNRNVSKALLGHSVSAETRKKQSEAKKCAGIAPPSRKGKKDVRASCIHCHVEQSVINLKGRHWIKCNNK